MLTTNVFGIPMFAAVQVAPPLVVLNTPLYFVPAYIVPGDVGSMAMARVEPPTIPVLVQAFTPARAGLAKLAASRSPATTKPLDPRMIPSPGGVGWSS